jgi:hypothetical protein
MAQHPSMSGCVWGPEGMENTWAFSIASASIGVQVRWRLRSILNLYQRLWNATVRAFWFWCEAVLCIPNEGLR